MTPKIRAAITPLEKRPVFSGPIEKDGDVPPGRFPAGRIGGRGMLLIATDEELPLGRFPAGRVGGRGLELIAIEEGVPSGRA